MVWGAIAAAAAPVIGGIIGGKMASDSQEETNAMNLEIATRQMQFQEKMSNTAYQRSMEDMRKAGLNPMLAYSQGGASTPQGASATMVPETGMAEGVQKGIQGAVSSAIEYRRLKKDIEQTDSNIELNKAAETAKKTEAEVNRNAAKKVAIEAKTAQARLPAIQQQSEYAARRAKTDKGFAEVDAIGDRAGKTVKAIMDVLNPFKWSGKNSKRSDQKYYGNPKGDD